MGFLGVVAVLILITLIIFGVMIFLRRRRRTYTLVPEAPKTTVEKTSEVAPVTQLPPKQESVINVTKQTSSSTTKISNENEKVPQVVVQKQNTIDKSSVIPVAPENSNIIISNQQNLTNEPTLTNLTAINTAKSAKKTKRSSIKTKTSLTTQLSLPVSTPPSPEKCVSPLLPVDSTQSPTKKSPNTEPTKEFGTDAITNHLAMNSVCKARVYVPRNEAPIPGSSKRRRRVPVVDEIVEYRLFTETYPCFAQREGILNGHTHMMLTERINVTIQHEVSDAERALLKGHPKDAPYLANVVLQEAEAGIDEHCHYRDHTQLSMNEKSDFWNYVNHAKTPSSVSLVVMFKLVPHMFELKEQSLRDERVKRMPLCGIYVLLLNKSSSLNFRIQLATELRCRALAVIPHMQEGALREAAYPTPYLTRIYKKNQRSFIEGIEIHSKSSKKSLKNTKKN